MLRLASVYPLASDRSSLEAPRGTMKLLSSVNIEAKASTPSLEVEGKGTNPAALVVRRAPPHDGR